MAVRAPGSYIDYTRQLDSQARTQSRFKEAEQWPIPASSRVTICDGPFDMALPPGDWKLTILRGVIFRL